MIPASLADRAHIAFAADLGANPPLSLRGANDVDSYRRATLFDPVADEPTDEYIEAHAFWGLAHLDAQSWRHYLPRLIAYATRHGEDPAMVVEALVTSLHPPDRYPPRLASLNAEQEAVVRELLEHIAVDPEWQHLRDDAEQAMEEWWGDNPRSRPRAEDIARLREQPMAYRTVGSGIYRFELPHPLTGGGVRDIPEEQRRVEVWSGLMCGDAHTVVSVNVTPLSARTLQQSIEFRRANFVPPVHERAVTVPGAKAAWLLEGAMHGDSTAESQALTMLLASTSTELVTLTIRTWPRHDVRRHVERMVSSLRVDAT